MKANPNEQLSKDEKDANEHYIRALIQTIRNPLLILNSDLRVVEANEAFYHVFKVTVEQTEGLLVYELGNKQWNIEKLKKLLEDILPDKKIVKDYEVEHEFETIGKKVMLLNADQVDSLKLILLAFEDITVERRLEKKLTEYTRSLEAQIAARTKELTARVKELEDLNESMVGREVKMVELKKELDELKKKM